MIALSEPTDIFRKQPQSGDSWEPRSATAGLRIAHWLVKALPPLPGLGFRCGRHVAFARSVREDRSLGGIGLVEYALTSMGDLTARWAHRDLGPQIGTGAAKRTAGAAGGFAGLFLIIYRDAQGAQVGPECTLEIAPATTGWTLTWSAGAQGRRLFEGVGLQVEDRLISAWAPPGEPFDLVVLCPDGDGASARCVSADGSGHDEAYVFESTA